MPTDDLIRFTREVENIAQFLSMRDNTADFVTRLRRAGDLAQSEITELTLYDLADQLETRMQEQQEAQHQRMLEPIRDREVLSLLADPEIDPENLRAVAFAMDGMPNEYWSPLSEQYRRDAVMQLRERANYGEFNARNFAERLATDAGLDLVELRDTVEALNNEQFDHEVLRGLPFAERNRSAQRTAMELSQLINQIQNGEAIIPQQIAQAPDLAHIGTDLLRDQITQMETDTGGVWDRVNQSIDRVLGVARRQGADADAVGRAIRQGVYMDPDSTPIEREYIAREVVAALQMDAQRPVGGNANGGPVRGYQAGGSVKKPDVPTPWLFSVPTYSETVAYEMYPGQKGQNDRRDAARHMLAAGTLSRKYGPKTAEFLGKAHEYVTSPLQSVKSMFTGKMPADYDMDTHNNTIGARLGQRAKSQAELEDLVQEEAERASRTQTQDKAFIKKANGGIVQQNPTTDQMRYALMMRRK
jgi:hypothetical protein